VGKTQVRRPRVTPTTRNQRGGGGEKKRGGGKKEGNSDPPFMRKEPKEKTLGSAST